MQTRDKLLLLGALYAAQGLPYGFFTQAMPVVLRELGLSLPEIGLASLLALPWALKFLWAPAVDRVGTRRGWVLAMQAGFVLCALGLASLDPAHAVPLLLGGFLVTNTLAATQDVATDGIAVRLLSFGERGWGNGLQVAGYRAGMVVGGGGLLIALEGVGWSATLGLMALLLAALSLPLVLRRDVDGAPVERAERLQLRQAWNWLARPGALPWVAVLLVYKVGHNLAHGMLRPWLVDAGLGMAEIGWLLGTAGFTAGLVGALAGGVLVGVFGRVRSLVLFAGLQVVVLLTWTVLAEGPITFGPSLFLAASAEHFVSGLGTVALFTAMMDASRPDRASTDYTLQASAVVVATGTAGALSGFVAEAFGYAVTFGLGAGLALVAALLVAVPPFTALVRRTAE